MKSMRTTGTKLHSKTNKGTQHSLKSTSRLLCHLTATEQLLNTCAVLNFGKRCRGNGISSKSLYLLVLSKFYYFPLKSS